MSKKTKSITAGDVETPVPVTSTLWKHFRETGLAPLNLAALLSLDINPTKTIETTLKERHPEQHAQFMKRCRLLDRNYGHHPSLLEIDHKDRTSHKYGQIVDLEGVCAFARQKKLDGAAAMIREFGGDEPDRAQTDQTKLPTALNTAVPTVAPTSEGKIKGAKPSKADKGLLLTVGGLTLFIENLLHGKYRDLNFFLHEGAANANSIGGEVAALLGEISGQTAETIRRRIANGKSAVEPILRKKETKRPF